MTEAPGHPFYRRLNEVLEQAGFDEFCEARCRKFYHEKLGRPSLAPGMYFRVMLIGFFEGIESERGIAWRVADSLCLRQFLQIGLDERTPDHVTISRTRRLMDEATHQEVFGWVLRQVAGAGLLKGKTIGIDATTLEANAAMKSIVRRDTEESYTEYLRRLAEAAGLEATDEAALRRMDRRRKKKGSNEEWVNPHDPEAEITRMKDGRTALAYKAEHAVDMDTGAIVAVTTHGGAVGDTTSVGETLPAAGEAVAEQIAAPTADGKFKVNAKGVEEVVADKGYHSGEVLLSARESEVRPYIAEPDRGRRKWADKQEEQAAVYSNRQRIGGHRGKQLLRRRGEMVERTFAHAYETGALRRLYVRGKQNVQKRLLLQAAACNLALLLRKMIGAGTPRALQDVVARLFFTLLRLLSTINAISVPPRSLSACMSRRIPHRGQCVRRKTRCQKSLIFRHGLLGLAEQESAPVARQAIPAKGHEPASEAPIFEVVRDLDDPNLLKVLMWHRGKATLAPKLEYNGWSYCPGTVFSPVQKALMLPTHPIPYGSTRELFDSISSVFKQQAGRECPSCSGRLGGGSSRSA